MEVLILLETYQPMKIFQEIKEIGKNCSIVKEIKPPLHPIILQNYTKTWYEKISNKKRITCNPIYHGWGSHGFNRHNSHPRCKHTELQMKTYTLCKTCNIKNLKQACESRKCMYKTGKRT